MLSIVGRNTNKKVAQQQSLNICKILNEVDNIEQIVTKSFLDPCWGITVLIPIAE